MVRPVQAVFHALYEAVAAPIEDGGFSIVAEGRGARGTPVEARVDALGAQQGAHPAMRPVMEGLLRLRSGVGGHWRAPRERDDGGEEQRVDWCSHGRPPRTPFLGVSTDNGRPRRPLTAMHRAGPRFWDGKAHETPSAA
jgi:hypothetical protein